MADLEGDGDGATDLAVTVPPDIVLLLNRAQPPAVDADGDGVPDRCGSPAARFRRGDASADGQINITDAVLTLVHLFAGGGTPACRDAGDANDDGRLGISDPVRVLQWLFLSGERLPDPALRCGPDPTADALDCTGARPCG